jgi:hypothetical protein
MRQPIGPAAAYQTYSIKAPLSTHFRPATCEEVDCPDYRFGWKVHLEGIPENLRHTALSSGRKYRIEQEAEGLTWLVYEAGQKCFQNSRHRTRVERPEMYLVRGGDLRGNPTGQDLRRPEGGLTHGKDLRQGLDHAHRGQLRRFQQHRHPQ